jgi:choline dehydrogenase-like flavoprotein
MAARFLAQAGIDVTLLEAGAERAARGLALKVHGLTIARWHRRLRQRTEAITMTGDSTAELWEDLAPGGLTNHWSCAVPRFSPDDFRDAQRAGEAYEWPITYDEIAPWYEEVEPLLRIAGGTTDRPQVPAGKVHHAWRLGSDWTDLATHAERQGRSVLPIPYSYGSATTLTLSGTVFNSFVRLVKPALKNGRLTVQFDARVLRLEWSKDTGRVRAVIYRDMRAGSEQRLPCAAVVVAAGAINSARLLLASTSDEFPQGLGNTDGVLGRYLHDHPLGKLVIDLDTPMSVHPPAYISRPALERCAPLSAGAGAQWTGTTLRARSVLGGHRGRLPWIGFSVFGTMAPVLENGVLLDGSCRAADGSAGVALHMRHPSESERLLNHTHDEIVELLTRAGVGPRVRIWKIEPAGNASHYAGTCRMHRSPRFGMLDAWGRMHAVRNVVVADSSAFTTGPEKNPVLTAMALAARASDRLARDLKTGQL